MRAVLRLVIINFSEVGKGSFGFRLILSKTFCGGHPGEIKLHQLSLLQPTELELILEACLGRPRAAVKTDLRALRLNLKFKELLDLLGYLDGPLQDRNMLASYRSEPPPR